MTRLGNILAIVTVLASFPGPSHAGTVDTTPPQIVSFTFSPSAIDTGSASANVTYTVHLTDDLSGVFGGHVVFRSPSGQQTAGWSFQDPIARISGTDLDGVYRESIRFPQYCEPGVWTIDYVHPSDKAGNARSVRADELAAMGFPTTVTVTGVQDTTPPVLRDFTFSPMAIDTSLGPRTVTYTVHVTDDLSGVLGGHVKFLSPSGGHSAATSFQEPWSRISGTDLDGVYRETITFPQYSETGIWTIEFVTPVDKASNQAGFGPAELAAMGFPTTVTVTGVPDTSPPTLLDFSFSPTVLDTSSGPGLVTFTVRLADDLAGVFGGHVAFTSPTGASSAGSSFQDPFARISGTDLDGVYRETITIPQFSETGTWRLSYVIPIDKAGNQTSYGADFAERGFPTVLCVGTAAGPTISDLAALPSVLFPPTHQMLPVTISYGAQGCPAPICALDVSSNEPVNGLGDGDSAPDWEIVDAHHVLLRAERSAVGSGRIYTITVHCDGGAAGSTSAMTTVTVPHPRYETVHRGPSSARNVLQQIRPKQP